MINKVISLTFLLPVLYIMVIYFGINIISVNDRVNVVPQILEPLPTNCSLKRDVPKLWKYREECKQNDSITRVSNWIPQSINQKMCNKHSKMRDKE